MTKQTVRTGRRIGLLAGLTVVGFLGLGPVAAQSFAATPTQPALSITVSASDPGGTSPNNGWQSDPLSLAAHVAVPDSFDCNPNNGWQC
jgi:ABC-type transport system substrate-binding protein